MPLDAPRPGSQTYDAFVEGAGEYLHTDTDVDFASCEEQHFVRLYTIALDEAARGAVLESRTPAAWRFVVTGHQKPVVACDMSIVPESEPSRVLSVRQGSGANRCHAALQSVWKMPEIGPENCELRWLSIPGLSIEAFWLHSCSGDRIVPISPQVDELKGRTILPAQEFLAILQTLATERLAYDDGL